MNIDLVGGIGQDLDILNCTLIQNVKIILSCVIVVCIILVILVRGSSRLKRLLKNMLIRLAIMGEWEGFL